MSHLIKWLLLALQLIVVAAVQNKEVFEFGNKYYQIDSYYGSRFREFYTTETVLKGNSSQVRWPTMYDYDSSSQIVYFADHRDNTIKHIKQDQTIEIVAGIQDQVGYRDGDIYNSLFNQPYNLIYYKPDLKEIIKQTRSFPIIIKNTDQCKAIINSLNMNNYKDCEDKDSTNKDNEPILISRVYELSDSQLDAEYNKINSDTNLKKQWLPIDEPVLFVADKMNHCIRIIYLQQQIIKTWAGDCQHKGFMDGPKEINKFNSPQSIGVDVFGNVFVYDGENKYIRYVDAKNQKTYTLLNGACRMEDHVQQQKYPMFGLEIFEVKCYKNWKKTSGIPGEHIYVEDTSKIICHLHAFDCMIKNLQSNNGSNLVNELDIMYHYLESYKLT